MTLDGSNKFGNLIWRKMWGKGMSQEMLAHEVGASTKSVSRWINGKAFPWPRHISRLKDVLELTEADLVDAVGAPKLPSITAGNGYAMMSLGEASERFGSMSAVMGTCNEVASDFPVPQESDEYGSDERWLELYQISPDTGGVLTVEGDNVVGYWHALAVKKNTYRDILAGKNVNKRISTDDVKILEDPGTYKLYFVDLFIKDAHRTPFTRRLIRNHFIAFMHQCALAEIFFDKIVANITGILAKRQCERLDFQRKRFHDVHRYFDNIGNIVPAEIFELDIGNDADRLFSYNEELRRRYTKRGLARS